MTLDIWRLPQNATTSICSFLDDKSLVRLREVCKSMHKMVNCSILKVRKTVVNTFLVMKQENSAEILIGFFFRRARFGYHAWKNLINQIINDECILREHPAESYFTMKLKDINKILNYLKPFIERAEFRELNILKALPDIIQFVSDFFKDKHVGKIIITSTVKVAANYFYPSHVDLIYHLKPESVICYLETLSMGSFESLLQVADLVESLKFSTFTRCTGVADKNICQLIQGLLGRKCQRLTYEENGNACPISSHDVEKLIQIIHHSEKIVGITAFINEDLIASEIGNYRMRILSFGSRIRIDSDL